jgi:hypothetical protein
VLFFLRQAFGRYDEDVSHRNASGPFDHRDPPAPCDLVVDLFSDDPSEVVVPSFVIIPAGETTTFFDLSLAESRNAGYQRRPSRLLHQDGLREL